MSYHGQGGAGAPSMLGGANVRWLTAFIDRPAGTFNSAVRFWTTVTATSVSQRRGDRGQFATLIPTDGDQLTLAAGATSTFTSMTPTHSPGMQPHWALMSSKVEARRL